MCRFAIYFSPLKPVYLADLLTNPTHSIVKQSYDSKERLISYTVPETINADGFGVAWYPIKRNNNNQTITTESKLNENNNNKVHESSCLFRSVMPAWNDKNLHRLADKIDSHLIFAHVRAASMGIVSLANCHPFIHKKYTFMHNGGIHKFSDIKKDIVVDLKHDLFKSIQGTTDTEHAFMIFLNHMSDFDLDLDTYQHPSLLLKAMKKTIANIVYLQRKRNLECISTLNFAVTNGRNILVSRVITNSKKRDKTYDDDESSDEEKANTLYFSCGSRWAKCSDNEYRMRNIDNNEDVVIIASERLTTIREDWVEVPTNYIVLVSQKSNVLLFPIDVNKEVETFTLEKQSDNSDDMEPMI